MLDYTLPMTAEESAFAEEHHNILCTLSLIHISEPTRPY